MKNWLLRISSLLNGNFGLSIPSDTFARFLGSRIAQFISWVVLEIRVFRIKTQGLALLRALEGTGSSKEALVLGNGASVGKLDLEAVINRSKSLDIFAVNYFPLSTQGNIIVPNYLILSDLAASPLSTDVRARDLWAWIYKCKGVVVCVPLNWASLNLGLEHSRVIYFNDNELSLFTNNINPLKSRGYISLTAYKALAIARFIGYHKIMILGIDNDVYKTMKVNESNQVIQYPNHFFPYGEPINTTTNDGFNSARYFYDVYRRFQDLYLFSDPSVVNLDLDSGVDAFQKQECGLMLH